MKAGPANIVVLNFYITHVRLDAILQKCLSLHSEYLPQPIDNQ